MNPDSRLRIGVTLQGVEPPDSFQRQVEIIEAGGYHNLWITDSSLHARYVYSYLTLAAVKSRILKLGTGITHPYTRHPAVTANAIATVDEISGGRVILGLGTGDRPNAELGFAPARMQALRDMVAVTRRLLDGETVDFNGDFKLVNAQIHFPCRSSIPIYLACSGPKMLSLAGEIADGVIAQCGLFPAAIDFARERIAEGARKAGRSPRDIDLWIMACGAIDETPKRGLDKCRTMAAWFAQTAKHCCDLAGIDPALVTAIREAYQGGEFHQAKDAARLVPDEMVELFTLGGTPDRIRTRVQELVTQGVEAINFMPIGSERTRSLELFSEVCAALR